MSGPTANDSETGLLQVVYSDNDKATQEYFPLELSNADYASRILRLAGHVLREVYARIMDDDLAPPHLEDGKIVGARDIDNKHLFAYTLSGKVPAVLSKLLMLDAESLEQVIRILSLAESDLNKAPVPTYWTTVKVRRLFDAALRILEAAAQAGFALWASLNLSSMRTQYKRHLTYRDERLLTSFPHGSLEPQQRDDQILDEGWAMEENLFWRPESPKAVVKTKYQKAREKDESLQQELAAAARVKHLVKVENWEVIFGALPVMEMTKVDDGIAEKLCTAVQNRLKLMHQVNTVREAEAHANRTKCFKDAKWSKDQLNSDLLPKLREFEDLVEALWKDVAPSELVDSVVKLEYDSRAHAQDASNARDYVTARTLTEASERLGRARETLQARKEAANFMEEMAVRTHTVATMREDVEKLAAAAAALNDLDEDVQPPFGLLTTAANLDLGIQKWLHKWTKEKQTAVKNAAGKVASRADSAQASRTSSMASIPAAAEQKGSNGEATGWVPQEANDRQRVADILSLQSLAESVARSLKRLRWREKICGLILHPDEDTASSGFSLQRHLQTLLEAGHGANAANIACRIVAASGGKRDIYRLMDDRDKLTAAAQQHAAQVATQQQQQRKRWSSYEHVVFHGWFVREVGSWGTGDGQFRDPCGVAFAANGDIWVADRGNHRIHHLDASGKVLRAIGFRGKIEGQLENPSGLAVSPDGKNIYVADRGNDRVAVFNLDGACTGIIGDGTGKAPGCMQGPCGVAMRSDGQLAVCDYGNNRIQIFDAKGACAMILGRNEAAGEGRHRLLQPSAVCYNREGLVVVADYGNHRVVVFGEDGNVCKEIVGGEQGGSFNGPSAVGVNSDGSIVVADQGNHRLQVFDRGGDFLRSFGFKGQELGRLHNPRGIALGKHNTIAVADYGNHRIVIAELGEN